MPRRNGIALTRVLCEHFRDLKVIVLSICDEKEAEDCAKEAGASVCITKGQSLKELRDSIMRLTVAS